MIALSLPWSSKKVVTSVPKMNQYEAAKFLWDNDHTAENYVRYLSHETDSKEKVDASFKFLFLCGCELSKLYKEKDWEDMAKILRADMGTAELAIRDMLTKDPRAFVQGYLRNILIWKYTGDEGMGSAKRYLCLERMEAIVTIFPDLVEKNAAEVAIAFFLQVMADDTRGGVQTFVKLFRVANITACNCRADKLLLREKLVAVRDKVVMRDPELALSVQERISALSELT